MWFANFFKDEFLLILVHFVYVIGQKPENLGSGVAAKKETKSSFSSRILNNKEVKFDYERINYAFYSVLGVNRR